MRPAPAPETRDQIAWICPVVIRVRMVSRFETRKGRALGIRAREGRAYAAAFLIAPFRPCTVIGVPCYVAIRIAALSPRRAGVENP
jgi:hypothetical protein